MPEDTKSSLKETVKETKVSIPNCQEELNKVEAFYMQYEGKAGHNPFPFIYSKINPLKEELKKSGNSQTLADKIKALPLVPPTI